MNYPEIKQTLEQLDIDISSELQRAKDNGEAFPNIGEDFLFLFCACKDLSEWVEEARMTLNLATHFFRRDSYKTRDKLLARLKDNNNERKAKNV